MLTSAPFACRHRHGSMKAKGSGGGAQYIASVVAAYWVVSISMVYLNKVSQWAYPWN